MASESHSIDRSRTIPELSGLKPSPTGLHANGLYSALRQFRLELGYTTSSDGQQACVAVERLRIDVGYKRRVIHIAREYPPDSCEAGAVLEHELKHVSIDDRLLAAAVPDIRAMLTEAARHARLGPIPVAEVERARQLLRQDLEGRFARELAAFDARRAKAQDAIDVAAEYERVRRQCPAGWRAR